MANSIDPNLILVTGIVAVGGYFLWNSGALKSLGKATESVATATENLSSAPNNLINKTSEIVNKPIDATLSGIDTAIQSTEEVFQTISRGATDFIGAVTTKLSDLTQKPTLQPLYIPETTISSPAGEITPLGQQFLNSIPALASPVTTPTQPVSSGGGGGVNASKSSLTPLGQSFINSVNKPLSAITTTKTYTNTLGGSYSPFQLG
jgi:hypothetical protein